jgi:hypothetical protein
LERIVEAVRRGLWRCTRGIDHSACVRTPAEAGGLPTRRSERDKAIALNLSPPLPQQGLRRIEERAEHRGGPKAAKAPRRAREGEDLPLGCSVGPPQRTAACSEKKAAVWRSGTRSPGEIVSSTHSCNAATTPTPGACWRRLCGFNRRRLFRGSLQKGSAGRSDGERVGHRVVLEALPQPA